ncbi:MAG: hypothetical protein WDA22_17575 [Bacteroidota bacterium]
MKHFLILIAVIFITTLATSFQLKHGKYVSVLGKEYGSVVIRATKSDSLIIYGHPLGETSIVGTIDDSLLIIVSGCCEGIWFFKINMVERKKYYYKPDKKYYGNEDIMLIIDEKGIREFYKYLEGNTHPLFLEKDSLFSNDQIYDYERK